MNKYFIVHKPFHVLSQFSSERGKKTLADFFTVPLNAYPVGRLDYDSEGLLIITNDKRLNHLLLNPDLKHEREYWVQVEGIPQPEQLDMLRKGVSIKVNGKRYRTREAQVSFFNTPPKVAERVPPIRYRKTIPDTWLKIILTEGKNRQVRKMTAAVGLPTLRLIRHRIEGLTIENISPGEMLEKNQQDLYNLLGLKKQA